MIRPTKTRLESDAVTEAAGREITAVGLAAEMPVLVVFDQQPERELQ